MTVNRAGEEKILTPPCSLPEIINCPTTTHPTSYARQPTTQTDNHSEQRTSVKMLVKAMRIIPTLCFCLQYDICDFQRANISRSTSSSWLFHSKSDDAYTEELEQKKLDQDRIRKRRRRNLEHWGVEMAFSSTHDYKCTPVFPSKFDAVADDAFHAIRGTLLGLQRPDPNAAGAYFCTHHGTMPLLCSRVNLLCFVQITQLSFSVNNQLMLCIDQCWIIDPHNRIMPHLKALTVSFHLRKAVKNQT